MIGVFPSEGAPQSTLKLVKEIALLSSIHPRGKQQEQLQQVNQGKWTPLVLGWMDKGDQIHGIPPVGSLCSLFCGHFLSFLRKRTVLCRDLIPRRAPGRRSIHEVRRLSTETIRNLKFSSQDG
jgi:hypothetical protein